jgi:hypothetical protein
LLKLASNEQGKEQNCLARCFVREREMSTEGRISPRQSSGEMSPRPPRARSKREQDECLTVRTALREQDRERDGFTSAPGTRRALGGPSCSPRTRPRTRRLYIGARNKTQTALFKAFSAIKTIGSRATMVALSKRSLMAPKICSVPVPGCCRPCRWFRFGRQFIRCRTGVACPSSWAEGSRRIRHSRTGFRQSRW